MNSLLPRTLPLLAALVAPGCLFGGPKSGELDAASLRAPAVATTSAPAPAPAAQPLEPVLYARDGSVVSGPRAAGGGERTRDLAGSEGSRMYLLELYQQAIDEKESLQREVEALNASLQRAHGHIAELETHGTELAGTIARLEAEKAAQAQREAELAARLVTAQIGRLEAEKLLLETRIQWREVQGIVAGAEPGTAPASANRDAGRRAEERP